LVDTIVKAVNNAIAVDSIVVGASVSEGSFTKNFWVSQEASFFSLV
jgi:hypothetical protein